MKLEDYPTPITDAIQGNGRHQVTDAFDLARDLERKLRKCRAVIGVFALHFDKEKDATGYEKAMKTLEETE